MRLLTTICVCVLFIWAGLVTTGQAQQTGVDTKGEIKHSGADDERPEIINIIQTENDPTSSRPPGSRNHEGREWWRMATPMVDSKFMCILDNKTVRDIGRKLKE